MQPVYPVNLFCHKEVLLFVPSSQFHSFLSFLNSLLCEHNLPRCNWTQTGIDTIKWLSYSYLIIWQLFMSILPYKCYGYSSIKPEKLKWLLCGCENGITPMLTSVDFYPYFVVFLSPFLTLFYISAPSGAERYFFLSIHLFL